MEPLALPGITRQQQNFLQCSSKKDALIGFAIRPSGLNYDWLKAVNEYIMIEVIVFLAFYDFAASTSVATVST